MENMNQYLDHLIEYETYQLLCVKEKKLEVQGVFEQRKQFLLGIANGDRSKVEDCLQEFVKSTKTEIYTLYPQRFLDQILIEIHYIADAAIIGGVPEQLAYTMRNAYIKSLQKFDNRLEIQTIFLHCARCFLVKVTQYQYKNTLSTTILECISYISKHIHDKILISDLCGLTNLSTRQLARRFQTELECSCLCYIQKEKIKQAKLLLCCTRDTIVQIANQFAFCSESHFSNTFKKYTGMSPKKYRQAYSFLDDWSRS